MKLTDHLKRNRTQYFLLVFLLALIALLSVLAPGKFLSVKNFKNMGFQMAEFGILALGMSVVIMTGGINLSLVNSAMLSAIVGSVVMRALYAGGSGMPDVPVIIIGIAVVLMVSVLCGLANGFFVAYVGVVPLLVTLGTQTVFDGVSLNITRGSAISGLPKLFTRIGAGSVFDIPYTMLIYLAMILIAYLLIERTPWGVSVYMLGGNEKATRFSGINTHKSILKVYVFSAVMAGIAGILMTSRYNSARADYGVSYTMQSVAATVLGGTAITGGSGHVLGTVIAVAILQVISSGFNIIGLNRNITDIVTGLILIGVLSINYLATRDRFKKAAAKV
ncbi:MAG: ABC transporter permease [Christensenellaceae bacterium]|nr:ABC transporter permease [Christensenellaceae bacterium]MEA5065438.1 ABC transporter permease [Eubacteriales bacterium]MEA5068380.1 ABC transporter permease [Christensenellaceae bacterium]